ncbi:FecR domain-containing protein [Candidatus Woesebacteria bacterium]|nr:FecR domain-containing protein [Candidatus Woesebacteria bacterium]
MPQEDDKDKIDKTENKESNIPVAIDTEEVKSANNESPQNKKTEAIDKTQTQEFHTNKIQDPDKKSSEKNFAIALKKPKGKVRLIIILAIISFILFFASFLLSKYLNNSKKQPESIAQQPTPTIYSFKATAVYLTGNVSKVVNDRKVEIKEGDVLSEGDQIVTDEDSRVVLELDEGTIIRLGDSTKIILTQLQSGSTQIDEETGILFARVEKDESHKFITIAGGVTVESLGTAFSVEKDEEDVNVKVFESEVVIKKQEGDEVQLEEDKEWSRQENEIKNIDQKKLADSEFYEWSLNEEKLVTPTPSPTPKPPVPTSTPAPNYQISLSASPTDSGIKFSWTVNGIEIPQGFKIVKNENGNPVYPGNDYQYLTDPNTRSYTWKITDGKTWHFRVCQYLGGKCGVYSNDVKVTAPSGSDKSTKETPEISSQVDSITLTTTKISDEKAKLTWSVSGTVPNGFKVVWSKSTGPTYPTRDGDWAQWLNGDSREYEIGALQAGNTYHFRICEYLSGKCGTYSNEQSLAF